MKNFVTIREAEKIAKSKLKIGKFNWLISGAEDNYTTNLNIEKLNEIKLMPNILKKRKDLDFKVNFFGADMEIPLLLSPMGHQTQFHSKGEVETAIGLKNVNLISAFSTQGRMDLYDIRKKNKNLKIIWTIFLFGSKKWILDEIKRAENNDCIAIALCLDASVRSHRYLDRETRYDARKFGKRTLNLPPDPSSELEYDWNIIRWIKSKTKLPIILKGIINPKDAKIALKVGVKSIWVSNHGGRMLNSGISCVEALISIKKIVNNKLKIIVDGGVRRGSDIVKYLCLGADLVGVGRPAIFGLAIDGNKGVSRIFDILKKEFYTTAINSGANNLKDLNKNKILLKN